MRSVEASGTPATTRKRARNQTLTAGPRSLVSVPKLKVGDATFPPAAAADPSQLARPKEGIKSQVGTQMPVLRSPKQPLKVAGNAVHRGKENRPLTISQPGPASTMQLPVQHASSNKPALPVGNPPEPKYKLSAAVTTTKTAKHQSSIQETLPALTSDRLSPPLRHSDHQHGPSMTARQHATGVDSHNAMPHPSSAKHHQACSSISDNPAVCTEADQALLAQGVPLACHTAINKRRYRPQYLHIVGQHDSICRHHVFMTLKALCKLCRRPVGQAARYGEWYTGNDTDLDAQLLEYNAEQAHAASVAGLQPERRKSDLASYTADKDDASFTCEEDEDAGHKKSSRLRRSTIAPGQVCYDSRWLHAVQAACCIAPAHSLWCSVLSFA